MQSAHDDPTKASADTPNSLRVPVSRGSWMTTDEAIDLGYNPPYGAQIHHQTSYGFETILVTDDVEEAVRVALRYTVQTNRTTRVVSSTQDMGALWLSVYGYLD